MVIKVRYRIDWCVYRYEKNNARNSFSKISLYNSGDIHGSRGPFQVASSTVSQPLVIENDKIEVTFSPDSGYMQSITNKATKSKKKVSLKAMRQF